MSNMTIVNKYFGLKMIDSYISYGSIVVSKIFKEFISRFESRFHLQFLGWHPAASSGRFGEHVVSIGQVLILIIDVHILMCTLGFSCLQ